MTNKEIMLRALTEAQSAESGDLLNGIRQADPNWAATLSRTIQSLDDGSLVVPEPEVVKVTGQVAILFDFNLEMEWEVMEDFNKNRWSWLNDVLGDHLRDMIPANHALLQYLRPSNYGNHEAWIHDEVDDLVRVPLTNKA